MGSGQTPEQDIQEGKAPSTKGDFFICVVSTPVALDHPHCNEIVMVVRLRPIISKQNGSNRPPCNRLKRGVG